VLVLGQRFPIHYEELSDGDVGEYHGAGYIKLDPNHPPAQVFRTLLHEVWHAAYETTRDGGKLSDEDSARLFEAVMVSVLKDNRQLIDDIRDWL
jgi:hypothetical protein